MLHTDRDNRNRDTAWGMETDMSVEAKGFSAARNKAAVRGVRGVSGVQGSPMNHKKPSQLLRCHASAIGIDAGNKSVTYTTGSHPFLGGAIDDRSSSQFNSCRLLFRLIGHFPSVAPSD
jgi:hypothetical protein